MNVFIACSSSECISEKYNIECKKLLEKIFEKENNLIFGAYDKGLMKDAYKEAINKKRKVIGILPEKYIEDAKSLKLDELVKVESISERGRELLKRADTSVFLPGGIGTILELSMALDMKRNDEIKSKIVIYNVFNFFDNFLKQIDKIFNEEFTNKKFKDIFLVSTDIRKIIKYIEK